MLRGSIELSLGNWLNTWQAHKPDWMNRRVSQSVVLELG